jgi:hypothetical protein
MFSEVGMMRAYPAAVYTGPGYLVCRHCHQVPAGMPLIPKPIGRNIFNSRAGRPRDYYSNTCDTYYIIVLLAMRTRRPILLLNIAPIMRLHAALAEVNQILLTIVHLHTQKKNKNT